MNQGTRLILSEKKKGNKNPMFHKEHSDETKRIDEIKPPI
jgi:hypothetical protein